jgi:hypothetical protein
MMYARRRIDVVTAERGSWRLAVCVICVALVAVALLTRDALAQEGDEPVEFDLGGVVVDDVSGAALAGAFVSLAGSDWGSLTNDEGRFRIPDTLEGRTSLSVEMLGYETLVWAGTVSEGDAPVLRLVPQAIVLEGLRVVTDRFQSRRNGTATSVRAFDRGDLTSTPEETVLDFVAMRTGLARTRCPAAAVSSACLYIRGRLSESVVYVDEMPVIGGLDHLDAIQPHELYMVEVYARGRHIRAYTNQFMERAAKTRLQPIALLF